MSSVYLEEGFYEPVELENGTFTVQKRQLTQEEYNNAIEALNRLDEYGFEKD